MGLGVWSRDEVTPSRDQTPRISQQPGGYSSLMGAASSKARGGSLDGWGGVGASGGICVFR